MRLMVRGIAVAGAVCVLSGTAQAADGLLIVQKVTNGGTPTTSQVQIEAHRMRTETATTAMGKQIMIFDGAKQAMTMIDPDKKTYVEMTQADVEKLGSQMNDAMAQMKAQLANLPPEQRAKIEAMMKGRGADAAAPAAPKTQYRKAGTDTVGKWTCDKYEGFNAAGQKTVELCTVDPKVLGFAASDFAVAKDMAAFFAKMYPQMGAQNQMFSVGTVESQGFSGIPVRHSMTIAGRQISTEISEVSRQNFPDSLFKVPEGYQKTEFPGMAGRGRGRQ